MSSRIETTASAKYPADHIPPLEPGDRLSRVDFEVRYDATPNLTKAELIEGIVYMPSPVRLKRHAQPHGHMITWLGTYEAATPGVIMADNTSLRLDLDNEPQPDAALLIAPEFGGQARISEDDYLEGAPELIVEVSSSSVSYDLGDKMHAYRRNGVREYVVWRVLDGAIDWFVLREGVYESNVVDDRGVYRSQTFPGLWLSADTILRGDLAGVLEDLKHSVETVEHAAFVEHLQRRSTSGGRN